MRSVSKMRVTKRTYRKHESVWNQATSTIADILGQAETPEQYCQTYETSIHNFDFVSKSRRGINAFGTINLVEFYENTILTLAAMSERWCNDAKAHMKANHPWKNQTGDAEAGLNAVVAGIEDGKVVAYLFHNIPLEKHYYVEYGTLLETYHYPYAGLLRIIQPTIEEFGPQLISSLQGVLNG